MCIRDSYGATAVEPEAIHSQGVDVFAPCAMGAILNEQSISEIKAKVVCGLANNQLATPADGGRLAERGIHYVPDYVVNAGGMIGASTVVFAEPDRDLATRNIHALSDTIKNILRTADTIGQSSADIADEMARARIAAGINS